ncbi:MAG: hypothetical protein WDN48_06675 [Pseudolabrys sp.]
MGLAMNSGGDKNDQKAPKKVWELPVLVIREIDEITHANPTGTPEGAGTS